MSFARGQLIADRYRLINLIGEGALGPLWRAADRVPDRQVVVRCVSPFAEAATRNMLEELDAARALRDRCIGRVHRVGTLENGRAFVVSELLVSESLQELLDRRGQLSPGAALSLVSELARAVANAHDRRIAHRAISPRTILLHRDEQGAVTPKLVDFGRAAVLDPLLAYASPEQQTGESGKGFESDVWALGVLLFRCVTGVVPFKSLSEAFDAERVVTAADVPEVVRDLLASMLRPARVQRPSAARIADECQLLVRRAHGGFRDLEKMVRIQSPVWLDAAASGLIDHVSTIPALGGAPPPRPSNQPIVRAKDPEEREVKEREREVPLPRAEPKSPPPPPPPQSEPPQPELLPAARATPIPDDVFVDFGRRRRHVIYGAIGVAAAALVALVALSTSSRPARRAPTKIANVRVEPAPAPTPTPTPTVTAVAVAAPTVAPKRAVAAVPPSPTTEKPVAEKRPTGAPIAATAGIPLWDPKPAKPVDDNPYE